MSPRALAFVSLLVAGTSAVACGNDPAAPVDETIVASIVPVGGASGVDPAAPIVITFSHPMGPGMEAYVALHEGDVTGPEVVGTSSWNADRTQLTFTPEEPLKSQTQYTLHLGGGMRDAQDNPLGYEQCVGQHGGQWATQERMGGMGSHMGPGWQHENGSYGVLITFTTG